VPVSAARAAEAEESRLKRSHGSSFVSASERKKRSEKCAVSGMAAGTCPARDPMIQCVWPQGWRIARRE
jgi:ribosome modulation factor